MLTTSCVYKNSKEDIEKHKNELSNDSFNYSGKHSWSFQLMGTKQTSIHTFYADSIVYEMKGKVHSTKYVINKLSYDSKQNKWIGESPDNTVYVLFFKEKTDSTVTLYKHKCKKGGLEEAIKFNIPKPDATNDHGWNTYALDGYKVEDKLLLSGRYFNNDNTIELDDTAFIIDGKKVLKMSFHSGERRWVGKYQDKYVQVFFKELNDDDSLQLSINWFDDLETLYKIKYNTINHWMRYEKQ